MSDETTPGAPATPQAPSSAAATPPATPPSSSVTQPPAVPPPSQPPAPPSAPAELTIATPAQVPPGYPAEKMIAHLKSVPGMTKEVAERLLQADLVAFQSGETARQQAVAAWGEQVRSDPELGGARYEATLKRAEAGANLGGRGAALREVLGPLASHPELVRYFAKVDAALGEDGTRPQRPAGQVPPTQSELLREAYPTMFNPDGTPK